MRNCEDFFRQNPGLSPGRERQVFQYNRHVPAISARMAIRMVGTNLTFLLFLIVVSSPARFLPGCVTVEVQIVLHSGECGQICEQEIIWNMKNTFLSFPVSRQSDKG